MKSINSVGNAESRKISANIIGKSKNNKTKSLERTYLFWLNDQGNKNHKQESKISSNKMSFTNNNNTKSIY